MLSLELKDAYIYNLYSDIFAYDDTTDSEDRTIIQRDLALNGTNENEEDFKIKIHSLGTDNNIDGDFGNDFITEMILSIVSRKDEFKELCLDEFIEKLKEITNYYACEDDGCNFRKIKVTLRMVVDSGDIESTNDEPQLYIETKLPSNIINSDTVLITILDYEAFVSKIGNTFIKDSPDTNVIIDSFACGANGDFRFIAKMAEEKDWGHLDQSRNQELVEFANGVLKENIQYKGAWAVPEMTLKRILDKQEDGDNAGQLPHIKTLWGRGNSKVKTRG